MNIAADKIRNFVIAGHAGSGKTSLCDLMLFKGKVVDRCGKVDQKNSISDYTVDEQEKMSSIYATTLNCPWNDNHFFFNDTPGYGEFICETIAAMAASDAAIIVVDGIGGIEVGTARAMKLSRKQGIPRMIFINHLDSDRANYQGVLSQIQEAYGKSVCVPFTMPVGKADDLESVVHILRGGNVPEEMLPYKEIIMDTIAESDEELMMKYLDGEELSEEEMSTGLHKAILTGDLIPVFAGSVEKDVGITELMNGIVNLLPDPLLKEKAPLKDGGEIELTSDGGGVALVYRSIVDPFIGQLTFFRVVSGVFHADSEVHNISTNHKERLGHLYLMNGKNQVQIDEVLPGMLFAVPKLKHTKVNNTLAVGHDVKELLPINFPNAVMSYAITAVKSGEEEKIGTGLMKLAESDPGIKVTRSKETHELILSGRGDQHLHHILKKLKENAKVEVNYDSPKVPYRETITSVGQAQYRHKKQSGGAGQFAEVHLRIEPNEAGYEFVNEVVGGNIPKNFIPAVEKGITEALGKGPLVGCKVENVKVAVYDGKHHPVDSNEMAFKIAARTAFRNAMKDAKPIILEPVQHVKILIPDEFMGDISGDLSHKRGRILGMGVEDGMQVVEAEVPLSEMARYATELRSMTQGRGLFQMEFSRYEMVPSSVAKGIIEEYQKEQEEEHAHH